jgi:hypothetical protein
VLAILKQLQLATLNVLPCERIVKWEYLPDFETEHIIGGRLVGASVTKLQHYSVYRERQFLRLCRRTRIMGRQHQRRGTVGENQ